MKWNLWSTAIRNRKLIVLSGTKENDDELEELSNINIKYVNLLSKLLRIGGISNISSFLEVIYLLKANRYFACEGELTVACLMRMFLAELGLF